MAHSVLRRAAVVSLCLATSAAGAPAAWAASESVLYSFKGSPNDGAVPVGVILSGGVLYGVTEFGGSPCSESNAGCGTAFSVALDGTEAVLHVFGVTAGDGSHPNPGLIEENGSFYGTTFDGGTGVCDQPSHGCGTLFTLTPPGSVAVIYSFPGDTNNGKRTVPGGQFPNGDLIQRGPALYGTTQYGGAPHHAQCPKADGCGTIFRLSHSGKIKLDYQFNGDPSGWLPGTGVVGIKKVLYGTTEGGGAHGYGAVYQLTEDGTETILYSFTGKSDGNSPNTLVALGNELYGTTLYGGGNKEGTLFKIDASGVFHLLYTFTDNLSLPTSLVAANGSVYGTVQNAGQLHGGAIFKIDKQGQLKTIYYFNRSSDDGNGPNSLTYINGTFYGTTAYGGTASEGTVFQFTP